MLKEELEDLFNKRVKGADKRTLKEYEDLKSYNREVNEQLKLAREDKDYEKIKELISEKDTELEVELRNKINDTIRFEFRNTSLELDASKLEKMKNPDRYVNQLYFNRTSKQIDRLIKQGKESQAEGLIKLATKSLDKLDVGKAKEKAIRKSLRKQGNELTEEEDDYWDDYFDEQDGGEEPDTYEVIYTTSGSVVGITVV